MRRTWILRVAHAASLAIVATGSGSGGVQTTAGGGDFVDGGLVVIGVDDEAEKAGVEPSRDRDVAATVNGGGTGEAGMPTAQPRAKELRPSCMGTRATDGCDA